MENRVIVKRFVLVMLLLFLIASCEQPNGEDEFINTNDIESFEEDAKKFEAYLIKNESQEKAINTE
ncbi:hypothetical protein [Aquimarina sp. AU474]|uniref:hypothetical protein n=1 Tax=Aquimarina sp. AU474 TaxID=2108529 RepID=UPI000D688691|nr:hypothetical protein [Aquimarina sp. AU474]